MYTAVSKLLKLSLECFMEQDGVNKPEEKLAEIAILEASIDKMERRYQNTISNVLPKANVSQELVYCSPICFLN